MTVEKALKNEGNVGEIDTDARIPLDGSAT